MPPHPTATPIPTSTPALVQAAIDWFSQVFPDYRERVVRHEAAHFLTGYLLGVPVGAYSLTVSKEHTDFAEAQLQARGDRGWLGQAAGRLGGWAAGRLGWPFMCTHAALHGMGHPLLPLPPTPHCPAPLPTRRSG